MNRILFYIVLVSFLVSAPVAIKFAVDAKRIQKDLSTQVEAASVVRAELAEVSDKLKSRTAQIAVLFNNVDSLSRACADASTRADRLWAKSTGLTKTIDSLRDLSSVQLAEMEAGRRSLADIQAKLIDTSKALSDNRNELAIGIAHAKERDRFLTQLQPWYIKWKPDATERNWFEKIFGADKAKSPAYPEPLFPTSVANPIDSTATDTASALQASK